MTPVGNYSQVLEKLASFLKCIAEAWRNANQEQRNGLGRQVFEEVWLKDNLVFAVRPRPELEPFFLFSFEEWRKKFECAGLNPIGVASDIALEQYSSFDLKNGPSVSRG